MSTPPPKRQRVDTSDDPLATVPQHVVEKAIQAFSKDTLRSMLFEAADNYPPIRNKIGAEYDALVAQESARVIDFDHYSKSVWKELNITHRSESGSSQYNSAGGVFNYITSVIDTIGKRARPESSLGTKKSALETLRKIGKSIAMSSTDTLGHEVIKDFQTTECLEATMLDILESMDASERSAVSEKFVHKLEELVELGNDQCIFEGLEEALGFFNNPDEIEGQSSDEGISEEYESDGEPETTDTKEVLTAHGGVYEGTA